MKNIENGMYLSLHESEIIPKLTGSQDTSKPITVWNLNALETIVTTDTIKDSEERNRQAYKKRRSSNMIMGAVVGGVIDGSSGGDSIIDGVLIGAVFGGLATGSPSNPKAQIGLIFKGGSTLSLEVDKEEYNLIQTFFAANKTTDSSASDSYRRELRVGEKQYIWQLKATKNFSC